MSLPITADRQQEMEREESQVRLPLWCRVRAMTAEVELRVLTAEVELGALTAEVELRALATKRIG